MSRAVKTRSEVEFADVLPGVADEDHYSRLVPRYALSTAAIDQAEAAVADMEARAASIDARRVEAIESGDSDALIEALHDEGMLPLQLHTARIRLAKMKAEFFAAESARVRAESSEALTESAQWIKRLQQRVLEEAARVRQACTAADSAATYLADRASEAQAETRRLRRIDPTKTPERLPGVRVDPFRPSAAPPVSEIESLTFNNQRDIVGKNGKPIVQKGTDGKDLRVDGYRVRIDGVLIDADGQPVKGAKRHRSLTRD